MAQQFRSMTAPYFMDQGFDWGQGAARVMEAMNAAQQQRADAIRKRQLEAAEKERLLQVARIKREFADDPLALRSAALQYESETADTEGGEDILGAAADASERLQQAEDNRFRAQQQAALEAHRDRVQSFAERPTPPGYDLKTEERADGEMYYVYMPEDPGSGLEPIPTDIRARDQPLVTVQTGRPGMSAEDAERIARDLRLGRLSGTVRTEAERALIDAGRTDLLGLEGGEAARAANETMNRIREAIEGNTRYQIREADMDAYQEAFEHADPELRMMVGRLMAARGNPPATGPATAPDLTGAAGDATLLDQVLPQ